MKLCKEKVLERAKGKGGFTLVEILVALSILSFGILAIASMQTSSRRMRSPRRNCRRTI